MASLLSSPPPSLPEVDVLSTTKAAPERRGQFMTMVPYYVHKYYTFHGGQGREKEREKKAAACFT